VLGVVATRRESDLDSLDARGEEGDRDSPVTGELVESLAKRSGRMARSNMSVIS
jgi:hypothetical protein